MRKVISDLPNKLFLTKGMYGDSTVRRNGDFLHCPQHEMSFLSDTVFELEDEEKPEMEIIYSAPITPGMTYFWPQDISEEQRFAIGDCQIIKTVCIYKQNTSQGGLAGEFCTKASMEKTQFKNC